MANMGNLHQMPALQHHELVELGSSVLDSKTTKTLHALNENQKQKQSFIQRLYSIPI